MNPLFKQMNNGNGQLPSGLQNMITAFADFRSAFRGDPRETVKMLMDSGRMTQDQFNQLANMANTLSKYFYHG